MRVDIDEALRYAGVRPPAPPELRRRMEDIAARLERTLRPRRVWRVWPLARTRAGVELTGGGVVLPGTMAARLLEECEQAAALACTVGEEFDALLRARQVRDMAQAVLLDACGSAWVEALCGETEREIAARFPELYLTDRFSPGYGDLPLEVQRPLCAALDAPRRAGIHVTDSLLLNPVKSVTAVVGLSRRPQGARVRGCACCRMRENCLIRKGGDSCVV